MRTMRLSHWALLFAPLLLCSAIGPLHAQDLNANYAREPNQPIDQHYTGQIQKYTTDKAFISPLVDYLPASKTVPTRKKY